MVTPGKDAGLSKEGIAGRRQRKSLSVGVCPGRLCIPHTKHFIQQILFSSLKCAPGARGTARQDTEVAPSLTWRPYSGGAGRDLVNKQTLPSPAGPHRVPSGLNRDQKEEKLALSQRGVCRSHSTT